MSDLKTRTERDFVPPAPTYVNSTYPVNATNGNGDASLCIPTLVFQAGGYAVNGGNDAR